MELLSTAMKAVETAEEVGRATEALIELGVAAEKAPEVLQLDSKPFAPERLGVGRGGSFFPLSLNEKERELLRNYPLENAGRVSFGRSVETCKGCAGPLMGSTVVVAKCVGCAGPLTGSKVVK